MKSKDEVTIKEKKPNLLEFLEKRAPSSDKDESASREIESEQNANVSEKTWELLGETLNTEELKLLIKVSESNESKLKVGRALLLMFYHLLLFILTPIIAAPIIYVLEGFDYHLIHNMRFLKFDFYGIYQFVTSLSFVSSILIFQAWHEACSD